MEIEPPNLGVPLYRRDKMKLMLPVIAGIVAWLWRPSSSIPESAVSFFVGGAFLGFGFASGFSYQIAHHRVPIVRGLWLVAVIIVLLASCVMSFHSYMRSSNPCPTPPVSDYLSRESAV